MYAQLKLLFLCTTTLFALVTPSAARTLSFSSTDANLNFSPAASWTTSSSDTNGFSSTSSRGASLSFSFAGQQVTVLGSSTGAYQVTLDVTQVYEFTSAENGRLFRASNLDESAIHSVVITQDDLEGGEMSFSQVRVAYESSTGLVPSLVSSDATVVSTLLTSGLPTALATAPGSSSVAATTTASAVASRRPTAESLSTFATSRRRSATSTTLTSSSSSSSYTPSRSSAMTVTSSSPKADESTSSSNAGAIAGAVVGSLAGLALLILLALFFIKRRKSQAGEYHDADTGRQRNSGAFSAPPPIMGGVGSNGGIGGSPRAPVVETVGGEGEGWAARIARNNSWRRKAERLPETRAYYNVTSEVPLPSAPPPAVPPPRLPPSAVLMMADAHPPTVSKPSLPRKLPARYSPPPMVESPSAVPISRPTRNPSQPQRFHVPTASHLPSSAFTPSPSRQGSSPPRAGAPLPPPPSSPSIPPTTSARLEEVVEGDEVVGGEEDRPHYFQTREQMPKYSQADGDPRR
ncbi:hypothetical protein BCR35DRAFT_335633 [Leucosporidium creatinivorum]|uniref:Mid2 domain-containing protein n=1 Tax=Leucosporidium creatinivorum TaxID=106004 RepID=A0A1Y2D7V6_9BASI|nr:hypothetical protein BCR35DRAFT_335633 [Leucosporidium creatinivorum]